MSTIFTETTLLLVTKSIWETRIHEATLALACNIGISTHTLISEIHISKKLFPLFVGCIIMAACAKNICWKHSNLLFSCHAILCRMLEKQQPPSTQRNLDFMGTLRLMQNHGIYQWYQGRKKQ
mgnify:CR=1 FL=1